MRSPHFQIPRNSLVWLLVAQALLLLPHLSHLPIWILTAWLGTVVWRVQIYRGLWPFPGRWVKGVLVTLCFTGLLSGYERVFSIEAMVGLLVTAFLLKLLEMHRKRDALIVILLGYFVAGTHFLFSQSLLAAIYISLALVVLTATLLSLHQAEGHRRPWQSFKLAGGLILQSLPLMVVLFIVMPRVGSLWAVPQPEQKASTGISDMVAPGDFSALAQDNSTAFRVTFDGDIPPARELYWRGLVLSRFDGRRWSRAESWGREPEVSWSREPPHYWWQLEVRGEPVRYEIILEPTQQHWLFALPLPTNNASGLGYTRDFRLVNRQPIRQRIQYEVESHLNYRVGTQGLSESERRQSLSLPASSNPMTRRMAREWFAESADELDYINRILNYFRQDFVYTLEPPLLGEHSLDEFLWQSKRGFCEHYASAFAFMMRAVGVPARVVVGYQGGELNPLKNFLQVRQSDAHAWTEVWLPEQGWLRIDPTAAVSPERIESGLRSLAAENQRTFLDDPFSLDHYANWPALQMLRLRLEALEYDWHRWIMNYDGERQRGFLTNLLGSNSPWRVAAFLTISACIVLGSIAFHLLMSNRERRRDPAARLYANFLRRLRALGIVRQPWEGPRNFAMRVEQERPNLGRWARAISDSYERYRYAGETEALQELRRLVKQSPTAAQRRAQIW